MKSNFSLDIIKRYSIEILHSKEIEKEKSFYK